MRGMDFRKGAIVALISDPKRIGQIEEIWKSSRMARIRFEERSMPTLHSLHGLVLISPTAQLRLF